MAHCMHTRGLAQCGRMQGVVERCAAAYQAAPLSRGACPHFSPARAHHYERFNENDCGCTFDGLTVTSDADSGL